MASAKPSARGHTGVTQGGNVRFVKVERIGKVTVYKRAKTFSLYYREQGRTIRSPIDGNLAVARSTASKINGQLEDGQRSMFSFQKVTPLTFIDEFLAYVRDVQKLAWRTVERYRAALERFVDFAESAGDITTIDQVDEAKVQDFIRWLRGQLRARNGSAGGTRDHYRSSGIRFILSTCRTAFGWAKKRRCLPPYAENPFSTFPLKSIRDRDERERNSVMLTSEEMTVFLEACDGWQRPIFETLVTYGLRVAELTHLLVEDIDFKNGVLHIRSKPELVWYVKTSRERELPIVDGIADTLRVLVGKRKAGFVFLERPFVAGEIRLPSATKSPADLRKLFERELKAAKDAGVSDEKELARRAEGVARTLGKVSEKRIRQEFTTLAKQVGRPDVTKVHSLRHVFSTRAQEAGVNPLLVQQILGHSTLEMTGQYTHLGIETQRDALQSIGQTGNGEKA